MRQTPKDDKDGKPGGWRGRLGHAGTVLRERGSGIGSGIGGALNLGRLPGPLRMGLPAAAILLLGVAAMVLLVATKPTVSRKAPEEKVWTIGTTPVEILDIQPELTLLGEIVASKEAELRPLVSGRVIEVGENYINGGKVRKGDLLIAIDPFDYEAAVKERTAQLAEAQARLEELKTEKSSESALLKEDLGQLDLQKREEGRRAKLRARGSGSQKALDDSRMRLSELAQRVITREKTIAGLEARIRQQAAVVDRQQVALERAQRDLQNTKLIAPYDAFVTEAVTTVGKQVSTNDKVATVIGAQALEAKFHMSDSEYARLIAAGGVVGRKATVVWRAQARNFVFDGKIARTESQVDAASGGIDLYARIDGTSLDTVLRPGIFVEVSVPDRNYLKVVRLPQSALHGRDTVYVVEEGRLVAKHVEIMTRIRDEVLVQGDLRNGDIVATTSFAEIGPGVKVRSR